MTTFALGSWKADAACKEHPTTWWFSGSRAETARAKGVCAKCLVRTECLDHALVQPELRGIWGGTTPDERIHIRHGRDSLEEGRRVELDVA